jgi:hypothetical protein
MADGDVGGFVASHCVFDGGVVGISVARVKGSLTAPGVFKTRDLVPRGLSATDPACVDGRWFAPRPSPPLADTERSAVIARFHALTKGGRIPSAVVKFIKQSDLYVSWPAPSPPAATSDDGSDSDAPISQLLARR